MTARTHTYADVRVTLDHPVERVWAIVSDFGGIDRWVVGVTACVVDGRGPGAIRTVSLGEREVRERLEAIDPLAHRLRYQVLAPHGMPASNVCSEIALAASPDGVEITWRSEATDFEVPSEALGARIGDFYRRSIEALDRLLAAISDRG